MAKMKTVWLRIYRAAVFVGVVLMMNRGAPPVDPGEPQDLIGASVEDIREFFPSAVGVSSRGNNGAHYVLDAVRDRLGFVVTTSPDSDRIIGYSGPNNLLVAFGEDGKVIGISVLSSGDTPEYLEQVIENEEFMAIFNGKQWEEIDSVQQVDGVSGATLTSLAIAEGVIRRVAGKAPSLRFPKPLVMALDDTLTRKTGTHIDGVSWKRDPLGPPFQTNLVRGQRYLQFSAAWPLENGAARMVPVVFRRARMQPLM